jgi:CDP-glucose 4,6-dehydratase
MIDVAFWHGKRVLVTGHTGFIGGWTAAWLHSLGAKVTGYALPPPTSPSFYDMTQLARHIHGMTDDIRSAEALAKAFSVPSPEIIIHLAAQSLVQIGHHNPAETFQVNFSGTLNVLEQAYRAGAEAVVVMTSDKVYDGRRGGGPYKEDDPLGATDAYAASKVCCELAVDTYAHQQYSGSGIGLATVRAGNAVGGGDWAPYRLIPDVVRALCAARPLSLRQANSVRPWQHVLDAAAGLLTVAQEAARKRAPIGAWNIGPNISRAVTAKEVAGIAAEAWGASLDVSHEGTSAIPERAILALDATKAQNELGFSCPWSPEKTIRYTMNWYKDAMNGRDLWFTTNDQIDAYQASR